MIRSQMFMKIPGAILISIMVLCGCKKAESISTVTPVIKPVVKPDTTKTVIKLDTIAGGYLALGDSYTIGQSVPSNQAYPAQLENFLNVANLPTPPPTIIATTGWTTDNLIYAIAHSNITNNRYAFVTLLIGVNDQFEGSTQAHYRTNFVQLLHTAVTFARGDSTRVFVLSIPDYGVTPFAMGRDSIIGPQIDQFNAINKQESLNAGVNYLDITGISREAATDSTLIAPDGLHPSGKMYKLWIEQLGPMVLKRLQQK